MKIHYVNTEKITLKCRKTFEIYFQNLIQVLMVLNKEAYTNSLPENIKIQISLVTGLLTVVATTL